MAADIELSELERDALTELVNIGVSRAAVALRKMVGQQVLLSVPAIEVMAQAEAASLISERETGDLVAVRQSFGGAFSGRAMLIFPRSNGLELVRAVLGDAATEAEMVDMEQEALAETGNIILNNCLGTMANMLRQSLTMTLPEVMYSTGPGLFRPDEDATANGLVLFLYINFSILERDIRGYIAMLLDLRSMGALQILVRDFIASVMTDDAGAFG